MVTPVLFQTPVKVGVFKCSNDVWLKMPCVDGRFQESNLDRNLIYMFICHHVQLFTLHIGTSQLLYKLFLKSFKIVYKFFNLIR